ncbi:uncharacterized protein K452DRAFT_316890 [Aplosporella prunicola CBS 121167]|uniref:Uncharacterized protein n=1 Tax=Aplosporella prunicola CBS 121167 TaxID=1176127 RepID=A0A6A6BLI3_9PEZI|nr:uncharacterized protein K452DRAFT_316890 [Aplosporella prunicola CBS 121167]KAF2144155.1 hypothetical protein K452DRAFT_316890 [Aplosporella prunicola CBS 121167]
MSPALSVPVPVLFLQKLSKELAACVPANGASVSDESVKSLSDLLDALVETAALVNITASHRAGACNPLCSLLEKCQASSHKSISSLIWTKNIWRNLFDIFLDRVDNSKPKSSRQVLVLLTSLLLKDGTSRAQELRDETTLKLFEILFTEGDHSRVKPALQALAHFVQKELMSVDELLTKFDQWRSGRVVLCQQFSGANSAPKAFIFGIMNWVSHQDTTPAAGNMICTVLNYGRQQKVEQMITANAQAPVWVEPLESTIRRNPDSLHNFKSHVFPDLFKPMLSDYLQFLEYLHLDNHVRLRPSTGQEHEQSDELEASLLFNALQVGKDIGIVVEVDYRKCPRIEIRDGKVSIPDRLLGRLLCHERPETRLAALYLLVTTVAVTRPFTVETFNLLKRNLPYLHADTDANFRGEIASLTLQMVDRLRAAIAHLSKGNEGRPRASKRAKTSAQDVSVAPAVDIIDTAAILKAHTEFIKWFLQFLTSELHPTAAYQRHVSALKSLTHVMKSGLDPTVPQKALSKAAQEQIKWPYHIVILTPELVRVLFDLMMDPFDDVRHAASLLLKLGSLEKSKTDQRQPSGPVLNQKAENADPATLIEHAFSQFLERAEKIMLRSGRADHADGVARAYELLFERRGGELGPDSRAAKAPVEWMRTRQGIVDHLMQMLDATISAASSNLSIAVNQYPMHGILSGLRYIVDQPEFYGTMAQMDAQEIEQWKALHSRMLVGLRSIWTCVRDVLCNDAPEGHVPDDMEEEPDLTTKDILSYSWRALKEASSLLRVIVSKAPFELSNGAVILESSDFESLGKLCFVQLAELRHRGAFSTVAQTFAACCLRCSRSKNGEIRGLLVRWYEETLLCIRDKGAMITRRSAGLPSLITGICCAAPEGPLFERIMRDLKYEASQEGENSNIDGSHLPQVHALNCLKDVFTNTRLAQPSEPHIGEALSLAGSRLESNVWAIRNCGLMLFRALIDRLLGSGTTQNWKETDRLKVSRLSYKRYPNLLDIIVQLLTPRTESGNVGTQDLTATALEGVFPALQILQRARPPVDRRSEVQQLVLALTGSTHWHVRDMAARTIAALLGQEERVEWVLALLESEFLGQNGLHGMLSTVKYLVKQSCEEGDKDLKDDLDLFCFAMSEQYERLFKKNNCSYTKGAYVDILNLILTHAIMNKLPIGYYDGLLEDWDEIVCHQAKTVGTSPLRRALTLGSCLEKIHKSLTGTSRTAQVGELSKDLLHFYHGHEKSDSIAGTSIIVVEGLAPVLSPIIAQSSKEFQGSIAKFFWAVGNDTDNVERAAAARQALAELVDNGLPVSSLEAARKVNSENPDLVSLPMGHDSPSFAEGTLRLTGPILDLRSREEKPEKLVSELQNFVCRLECDLHEENPFPTRYAAVSSLAALEYIWTRDWRGTALEQPILDLSLVVYAALNDDEDEIRDVAASVVPRIIAGPRYTPSAKTVVPLTAARKLSLRLAHTYAQSERLCRAAVEKMLDSESGKEDNAPKALALSVQALLERARKESTALFAREKQNLFVDPVREAVVWCAALEQLAPAAVPRDLARTLGEWVVRGLAVLTETAKRDHDGALGWASKAEVWTLGMRVLCAADVLLAWRAKTRRVRVKSSSVKRAMREFADAGVEADVHGLLVASAEQVLAESVVEKLRLVRKRLIEVVGSENVV